MKLIECPRDAMQGLEKFIPTVDKVRYINQLMKVGFDTLDAGSFVSPKVIPQMSDTAEVLNQIDTNGKTKLLVIVANTRGAEQAKTFDCVSYIGFPLSLSETFQQRNTNKSIPEALNTLNEIQDICMQSGKRLVTYISMGFGNPYGDPYDIDVVAKFVDILCTLEIEIVSLADTVGVATPEQIQYLFHSLTGSFPAVEFGAHLHSSPAKAVEKIEAAVLAGCQRFDGAIKGYGGCPMADDRLVGNLATETIMAYLEAKRMAPPMDKDAFRDAMRIATEIFE